MNKPAAAAAAGEGEMEYVDALAAYVGKKEGRRVGLRKGGREGGREGEGASYLFRRRG